MLPECLSAVRAASIKQSANEMPGAPLFTGISEGVDSGFLCQNTALASPCRTGVYCLRLSALSLAKSSHSVFLCQNTSLASPCRTARTACGSPPCLLAKSSRYIWGGSNIDALNPTYLGHFQEWCSETLINKAFQGCLPGNAQSTRASGHALSRIRSLRSTQNPLGAAAGAGQLGGNKGLIVRA